MYPAAYANRQNRIFMKSVNKKEIEITFMIDINCYRLIKTVHLFSPLFFFMERVSCTFYKCSQVKIDGLYT